MTKHLNYMNININERTLPLQGLRVLLMFGIVYLHVCQRPVLGGGVELVSFFFVISGFLYRDKLPWSKYMKKKALGIYPTYWIVLFLSEIVCFLRGGNNLSWGIIPHVLLLQSWYPNLWFSFANYVGVAWFVSSLLFCYAASPFIYRCLVKNCSKQMALVVFLIIFVCICIIDSKFYVEETNPLFPFRAWLTYINPMFRLLEYMMGMLLWKIVAAVTYIHVKPKYELIVIAFLTIYLYGIYANWGGQIINSPCVYDRFYI